MNSSCQTALWLRGIAVFCAICSISLLCSAQPETSADATIAQSQIVARSNIAELPAAPVPHVELAQNTTGNSENQPEQQNQNQHQSSSSQQTGSQQPSNEPSLSDLGFSKQQTQSDPKLQAMLDKRTHMLKVHQRLGLITAVPMAAALITGPMAKAKGRNGQTITEPTQANLDFHAALGSTTAALYFTTAYFAVFAPKVPGVQRRGAIRLHRALAFVHGPGMIATPILGAMAFKQEQAGEKVHGIASAHGAVAWTTALAYGAAIVSVSWPIKVHF